MFVTPRTYCLSQTSDEDVSPGTVYHRTFDTSGGWNVKRSEVKKAAQMLLLHQIGSLHVGEVVRYTITYLPSTDHILPRPTELRVKIRNTSAIPLRAAYLHGPYTLYAACYPADFDPNKKQNFCGTPQFEPNVRAGGSWDAVIPITSDTNAVGNTSTLANIKWIIEISSQILFSTSAEVPFELLMGRDEKATELGTSSKSGLPPPGELSTFAERNLKGLEQSAVSVAGVYSSALRLRVDDTTSLWSSPNFPSYHEKYLILTGQKRDAHITSDSNTHTSSNPQTNAAPRSVHLVVVTHGLHSNVGADMLYLKESITKAAKSSQCPQRERQREEPDFTGCPTSSYPQSTPNGRANEAQKLAEGPIAVDAEQCTGELNSDGPEDVVVCGFPGNVVRTERGIQYLGKRLAKYVLLMTYPDQPYLPEKISHSRHNLPFARQASTLNAEEVRCQLEEMQKEYNYKITKISFIGHSLGGLIQTYALAYIQRHSLEFFDRIKPINFIALASPFLGLSHENPLYVRFALDFGLVGRTGQDLGLAWSAPSKVRSGWDAMIGGLGGEHPQSADHVEASSKPLLKILPTGAAHEALTKFEKRTLYANVVNDGIVPLRTSSLLFLDWKGLQRVTKARRENGVVGTMAEWGWAELTGLNATAMRQKTIHETHRESRRNSDHSHNSSTVNRATIATGQRSIHISSAHSHSEVSTTTRSKTFLAPSNPLSSFLAFFRPQNKHPQSKKATRIFNRSQTLPPTVTTEVAQASFTNEHPAHITDSLVQQANIEDSGHSPATSDGMPYLPPRTTLLEAAGDVLNPPIPSNEFITDPDSRPNTIFHDRLYRPCDIPPPPMAKTRSFFGTPSSHDSNRSSSHRSQTHSDESHDDYHTKKPSGMEVEEKIARAYHNKLSWRKVLVRLEPDAHNNIVVRRMFANAYGWPVVAHLVEHHFVEPGSPRSAEGQPAGPANNPQDSSTDVTKNEMPDSTDVAYASPQRRMSDPGIYHSNITLDTQEIVRFGPMKRRDINPIRTS